MQISAISSLRVIFAHSTFYCATAVTVTGVICPHFVAGEREKGKERESVLATSLAPIRRSAKEYL